MARPVGYRLHDGLWLQLHRQGRRATDDRNSPAMWAAVALHALPACRGVRDLGVQVAPVFEAELFRRRRLHTSNTARPTMHAARIISETLAGIQCLAPPIAAIRKKAGVRNLSIR
jgi:hypothetical protein